jgi:predicted TIM-barrel fold metal-dependent hydrolase
MKWTPSLAARRVSKNPRRAPSPASRDSARRQRSAGTTGGRVYVEAANGALADQIALGSSYPFRALRQSVEDYERLGFSDDVLDKLFSTNAAKLLKLA